jgi:hypothetical protein
MLTSDAVANVGWKAYLIILVGDVLALLFVVFLIPETRGISLEGKHRDETVTWQSSWGFAECDLLFARHGTDIEAIKRSRANDPADVMMADQKQLDAKHFN